MSIVVAHLTPQNFSIPAGYNEIITFNVDPSVAPSLSGLTIIWNVYEQSFGVATAVGPVIQKSSNDIPVVITISNNPLSFIVQMLSADTLGLLRNYYHEATISAADGEVLGGAYGIMTVTATENR